MAAVDIERIAAQLRFRRGQLRMTQAELAELSSVSEPTIRSIESRRQFNARASTLMALSEALGWTPDSLLIVGQGGEPVEQPTLFGEPATMARNHRRPEELQAIEDDLEAVIADLSLGGRLKVLKFAQTVLDDEIEGIVESHLLDLMKEGDTYEQAVGRLTGEEAPSDDSDFDLAAATGAPTEPRDAGDPGPRGVPEGMDEG